MSAPRFTETAALPSAGFRRNVFFCSFCEAPRTQVAFLITGPRAAICEGCLEACQTEADAWRAEKAKLVEPPR